MAGTKEASSICTYYESYLEQGESFTDNLTKEEILDWLKSLYENEKEHSFSGDVMVMLMGIKGIEKTINGGM